MLLASTQARRVRVTLPAPNNMIITSLFVLGCILFLGLPALFILGLGVMFFGAIFAFLANGFRL